MANKKTQADIAKTEAEARESVEDASVDAMAESAEEQQVVATDAVEDAEVVEDVPSETELGAEAEAEGEEPPAPEPADTVPSLSTPDSTSVDAAPAPVVVRKGGFVPMLLGGVASAAIAAGAVLYLFPDGWSGGQDDTFQQDVTARLEAQSKALTTLEQKLGEPPDLSPLETQLSDLEGVLSGLSGQLADAAGRLDALDARLTDLEKRPITEAASPAAVEAYERELKALQAAMAAQRAEIEKLAAEAAEKEANAEITAQEAMKRAAISRIQTALDTGAGFGDAAQSLAALGIALPSALAQVADSGVATRADLTEAFPESARAALAVARKSDDQGGIGAFLKAQLGARSLEPREGEDADAVLSRAEAALRGGRLRDAMAEIEALPEAARAEMSGWLSAASTRLDALAAAEALAAELN